MSLLILANVYYIFRKIVFYHTLQLESIKKYISDS